LSSKGNLCFLHRLFMTLSNELQHFVRQSP
jgi:hypothetical protein